MNTIKDGELSLGRAAPIVFDSDIGNRSVREFGKVALFTTYACAVYCLVIHVGFVRVPSEVIQDIVRRVPIVVTALHTFGAWADKGLKNQPMQVAWSKSSSEPDLNVPGGESVWLHLPPCRCRNCFSPADPLGPNAAVITDAVAGAAGNVAVLNSDKIGRSHDGTFQIGCVAVRAK